MTDLQELRALLEQAEAENAKLLGRVAELEAEAREWHWELTSANERALSAHALYVEAEARNALLEQALREVRAGISEASFPWLDEIERRAALAATREKP